MTSGDQNDQPPDITVRQTFGYNDLIAIFIAGFLVGAMFGFYRIWSYS